MYLKHMKGILLSTHEKNIHNFSNEIEANILQNIIKTNKYYFQSFTSSVR